MEKDEALRIVLDVISDNVAYKTPIATAMSIADRLLEWANLRFTRADLEKTIEQVKRLEIAGRSQREHATCLANPQKDA